jgi:hypothetical protein
MVKTALMMTLTGTEDRDVLQVKAYVYERNEQRAKDRQPSVKYFAASTDMMLEIESLL